MKKNVVKRMCFIAVYFALAVILDLVKEYFLPFLDLPFGGSINIALIPIVVASFHLGILDGCISGLLWWLLSSIMGLNPWVINIPQVILDYVVPSVVVGLAGIFYRKKKIYEIELGILFVMVLRTLSVVVSGALFWVEDTMIAGSWEAYAFSFAYNGTYNIASCVMLMIVVPIVLKILPKNAMLENK